jgi:hypothetical protein
VQVVCSFLRVGIRQGTFDGVERWPVEMQFARHDMTLSFTMYTVVSTAMTPAANRTRQRALASTPSAGYTAAIVHSEYWLLNGGRRGVAKSGARCATSMDSRVHQGSGLRWRADLSASKFVLSRARVARKSRAEPQVRRVWSLFAVRQGQQTQTQYALE